MKDVGIAAATGALFGALAAWALVPRTAASDTGAPELTAAVAEMKEAAALLRASIESGRTLAAARPEAAPPVATTEARRPSPPPAPDGPAPPPTRDVPAAPPGSSERAAIQELRGFSGETGAREAAVEARKRGGVRARWLFASEREVIDAFGVPDDVVVNDNSENWTYLVPARSDEESDNLVLIFSRGRLVQVW